MQAAELVAVAEDGTLLVPPETVDFLSSIDVSRPPSPRNETRPRPRTRTPQKHAHMPCKLSRVSAPRAQEAVSVVAVVGPYRTGKSFLINSLAEAASGPAVAAGAKADAMAPLGKECWFTVGSTVRACTRGLWMAAPPAARMTSAGGGADTPRVLFVDCEGLGAIKVSAQHDLRLFSLAVLLSSTLIFNTMGAIGDEAIKRLSFITQLTQNIHLRSQARLSPTPLDIILQFSCPRP